MLFATLAVTGVMGFFLPFSLLTVSVHSLVGFIFIAAIGLHLKNNFRQLRGYFSKPGALVLLLFVIGLIAFILWQPQPVKAILGLSRNLGPELDRFEMSGREMVYQYTPDPRYKMQLEIMGGSAFDPESPPFIAIWLENRSGYHIKSLHHTSTGDPGRMLPYWHFKRSEYLKYKRRHEEMTEAEKQAEVDAMSSATENDSFDPADYIVPEDPEREAPFRVMIEINAENDANPSGPDQPSLVYSVEVDNRDPRTFQVLEIVGYPKMELKDDEPDWSLHFADESITTARDLLDSALLRIEREASAAPR
jgi:hypothetical protein